MKLSSLKPRISTLSTTRTPTLAAQPDRVERLRGRAGVLDRARIRQRDMGLCQECVRQGRPGPGWLVDHVTPLWQGGSDDESNKQTLCQTQHDEKTAREAKMKARGY